MQNIQNQIFQKIFVSLQQSLRNSAPTRKWLNSKGIDSHQLNIGYDTGKHHRGKTDDYIQELIAAGLLHELSHGKYRSFAKNHLVFPLLDEDEQIANLYAYPMKNNQVGFYCKEEIGFYPKSPNEATRVLILTENIIDAAIQYSKRLPEGTTVLSLDNGLFTDRHKEVLTQLPYLETIQFAPYFSKAIQENIESFVFNHVGEINFNNLENFVVVEETTAVPVIDEKVDYQFEVHHAEYFSYQKDGVCMDILGGIADKTDQLAVTLKIVTTSNASNAYRNSINLYNHHAVQEMMVEVAEALFMDAAELSTHIHNLTTCLEQERTKLQTATYGVALDIQLPSHRKDSAKEYLQAENLYTQLKKDLSHIGISGEQQNLEVLFFAMTSRLLKHPLNVVLHATTGSGKSILMEAIADCMPKENYLEMTSLSQKSFYHFAAHYLSHKVLLIQDWFALDPELEYIIRELESKQKLSRYVTTRDKNNALVTTHKEVYGPVSIISATTQENIYADNANRSIQLYLNESKEQDDAIIQRQLQIAARTINIEQEQNIKKKLQDVQQLLQVHPIKNIYAPYLKLPASTAQIRRMNPIYINLIATITLFHQYQRKQEDGYLLTSIEDIEIANQLMPAILVPKMDLLPNANRLFFEQLEKWLKDNQLEKFTKKEIIRGLRLNPHTAKHHLKSLQERGYIQIIGGDRYKNGYEYQIVEDSDYSQVQAQVQEALQQSLQEIKHRFHHEESYA